MDRGVLAAVQRQRPVRHATDFPSPVNTAQGALRNRKPILPPIFTHSDWAQAQQTYSGL